MNPSDAPGAIEPTFEGGWPHEFFLEAQALARRLGELYRFPAPLPATLCGFGTPTKEGHPEVVLLCNAPAEGAIVQELVGTGGCCVRVRACTDHLDLLTRLHESRRSEGS